MNNEIKEILDYLSFLENIETQKKVQQVKDYITNLQKENKDLRGCLEDTTSNYKTMITKLENKITNLQEENEHLLTQLNTYENTIIEVNKECNSLFNHLTKKDLDYKSRNEKAIEYVEEFDFDYLSQTFNHSTREILEDLLNILKGEDNE